ncbi:MAG: hypothetical protein ACRDRL_20030 [Sciscionella sp.]
MKPQEDQVACDRLRQLRADVRAGERPPRVELERALEAGFGCLVALEAQLQRVRRAGPGTGGARGEDDLRERIDALGEVLGELRGTGSSGGRSRAGYGFVLPRR